MEAIAKELNSMDLNPFQSHCLKKSHQVANAN